MSVILFEIAIIFVLVVANGVFAMAEIALVSSKRNRLRSLAEAGHARAGVALELAENPSRFLATVQIGITLVGILTGVYGGATLSEHLVVVLREVPGLQHYAQPVSFVLVVVAITYLSLVVGELIPKRLGLNHPEGYAVMLARPMRRLSRITGPAVDFLSASTDGMLRLFGIKITEEQTISDEEVKSLMREGMRAGVFVPTESSMVENVLELDHLQARELMTPRAKIIWVNADEPHDLLWHKIVVSGHSYFPVYEGRRDHVVGVVSVKAIYANLAAGVPVRVRDVMTPMLMTPDTTPASKLLDTFKTSGKHLALVVDEFGSVIGLVTVHDIMEAIVGDFPSQDVRLKPRALRRDDGSWLIDAMMDCETFEESVQGFTLPPAAERDYQTFAGYLMRRMGGVPQEADWFEEQGYRVEVIDMDGHRVDKVLLMPVRGEGGGS
ncbi:hemolysin family protein [Verrucomicrobium spinosum]|uniref:hemolysin family protein n=1 Tax=Verrucomicrobium spinosum TaxID=2736 RepID=UPI00017465BA|nr:hemolysin family protein [Verrucomicrobium spinosum]